MKLRERIRRFWLARKTGTTRSASEEMPATATEGAARTAQGVLGETLGGDGSDDPPITD